MLHSHRIIVHEHGCYTTKQGQPARHDTWKLPRVVAQQFRRAVYFGPEGVLADVMRECGIGMLYFKAAGCEPYKPQPPFEEDYEIQFIGGDVNRAAKLLLDHFSVVIRIEA